MLIILQFKKWGEEIHSEEKHSSEELNFSYKKGGKEFFLYIPLLSS